MIKPQKKPFLMIPHCAGGKDSHYEEGMIIKKILKVRLH